MKEKPYDGSDKMYGAIAIHHLMLAMSYMSEYASTGLRDQLLSVGESELKACDYGEKERNHVFYHACADFVSHCLGEFEYHPYTMEKEPSRSEILERIEETGLPV